MLFTGTEKKRRNVVVVSDYVKVNVAIVLVVDREATDLVGAEVEVH